MDELQENPQYAGRALPQAIEAEIYLLGGLIQDPTSLDDVVGAHSVEADDFSQKKHRQIWEAIVRLYDKSTPIDLVTLAAELERENKLNDVGGREYLIHLVDSIPSAANAMFHAELLREKSLLRRLIAISNETIRNAQDPAAVSQDVLQKTESEVFALAEKRVRDSLHPIETFLAPLLQKIQNRKEGVTGVPTGFTDLDELTGGLQRSDLIILAGRPGMGKTAFALSLAANSAIDYGQKVAFFSLEMSGDQLVQRVLSARAQVDNFKLRSGKLNRDEMSKIQLACEPLAQSHFFVDDNSDLGLSELMSKTRKLKSQQGLDLIVLDYLQLMRTGNEESRSVAIGNISRGLKILAKDLQVPIIALAQLSRKAEEKGRDRPQLSDLRESGSIEQDADMVWFVERPFYRTHDESQKNLAQLLVAKHRNGSVADIDMVFRPEFTCFYNALKEDEMGGDGFGDAYMGASDFGGGDFDNGGGF